MIDFISYRLPSLLILMGRLKEFALIFVLLTRINIPVRRLK